MAELDDRRINEQVRSRLTQILSAAGVGEARIAIELLYLLPPDFERAYCELFDEALKSTGSPAETLAGQGALGKAAGGASSEKRGTVTQVGSGGKRYKKHWVVKDDRALELKNKIDKRLRGIAREIRAEISDGYRGTSGGKGAGQCGGCGRLSQSVWRYCPHCGATLSNGEGESDDGKA